MVYKNPRPDNRNLNGSAYYHLSEAAYLREVHISYSNSGMNRKQSHAQEQALPKNLFSFFSDFPILPAQYHSCWRVERKTYDKLVEDDYILWKKTIRNEEEVWWPYVKYYAEGRTKRPSPLWNDLDGNKKATREVRALFDNVKVFDYVKPVAFISRIIQIAPNMQDGDIILDFFSGSATTAHAVMDWNIENESKYKYIMVQLPADLDTSISSQKVTYDFLKKIGRHGTLDEVGQERILRAAKKIHEKNPETDVDLGFKHYTLKEISQTTLDKLEKFDNSGFITNTTIYDEFGVNTVLTTWLVHDNYGFVNKCSFKTAISFSFKATFSFAAITSLTIIISSIYVFWNNFHNVIYCATKHSANFYKYLNTNIFVLTQSCHCISTYLGSLNQLCFAHIFIN